MTLMRLRLGLSGQDFGYRFGVHHSTVSYIFANVVDVLYYVRLKKKERFSEKRSQWILESIAQIILSLLIALRYLLIDQWLSLLAHKHTRLISITILQNT